MPQSKLHGPTRSLAQLPIKKPLQNDTGQKTSCPALNQQPHRCARCRHACPRHKYLNHAFPLKHPALPPSSIESYLATTITKPQYWSLFALRNCLSPPLDNHIWFFWTHFERASPSHTPLRYKSFLHPASSRMSMKHSGCRLAAANNNEVLSRRASYFLEITSPPRSNNAPHSRLPRLPLLHRTILTPSVQCSSSLIDVESVSIISTFFAAPLSTSRLRRRLPICRQGEPINLRQQRMVFRIFPNTHAP